LAEEIYQTGVNVTRNNLLFRNMILNLMGHGVPALLAILSIPLLIRHFGTDLFGILILIWSVLGFSSLFDLGLASALTQMVAKMCGENRQQEIPTLVWTTVNFMILLSLAEGLLLILFSPWVTGMLKVPDSLKAEINNIFYLLAFSLPIVVTAPGLRGLLEAHQRFGLSAAIRIATGGVTVLSPLLVMPFSKNLFPVVAILMIGRLIIWVANLLFCLRIIPSLRHGIRINYAVIKPLTRFGGWMTAAAIIDPITVYIDRILIGVLVSMAAVAYYATPYEIVTRLWLVPSAIIGVLFPAFSSSYMQDRKLATELLHRGVNYVLLAIFPLVLIIVTMASEGLNLWLGSDFAKHSAKVVQLLAAGVFIDSIGQIPRVFLQGAGRPDLTTKVSLLEFPFYLLAVLYLVKTYGIVGVAIAWLFRALIDTFLVFYLSGLLLGAGKTIISRLFPVLAIVSTILCLSVFINSWPLKGYVLLISLTTFFLVSWFFIMNNDERSFLKNLLSFCQYTK
jgi:O-antigen/teichoic acid export membrane protein